MMLSGQDKEDIKLATTFYLTGKVAKEYFKHISYYDGPHTFTKRNLDSDALNCLRKLMKRDSTIKQLFDALDKYGEVNLYLPEVPSTHGF